MVSESPQTATPVAAIDIGTNSIHLVVARPTGNNRFEILARDKEVVRLGSASGDMKELHPDAIERGVAALGRFRRVADTFGAEVHAVATSAVREAENREEFLEAALVKANVGVEVISGVEEARLIHLGVLQAVPLFDRRLLLVDIGGGSTELVLGTDQVDAAISVDIGCVRLTERHLTTDPPSADEMRSMRKEIRAIVEREVPREALTAVESGIAVAGTATSLAAIDQRLEPYDRERVDGYRLSLEAAERILDMLAAIPLAERREVPGLHPERAPTIVAGAAILVESMRAFGLADVEVSEADILHGAALSAASSG